MKLNELCEQADYKDNAGMIFNANCLDIMAKMDNGAIDLVVTDPPYKTITGGDKVGKNSVRPKGILSGNRKLFQYQNNISLNGLVEKAMEQFLVAHM